MAPVQAVLFDYGDTLGDLAVAEQQLLETYREVRQLLQEQADHEVPEAPDLIQSVTVQIIRTVNASYQRGELEELDSLALFEQALGALGLSVSRAMCQHIAEVEYRAVVSERTVPPENLRTLEQLRDRGMKLGVVSNAHFLPPLMLEDFERLGISKFMDAIVISSQVGLRKPHPAIFQAALDAVGVPAEQAVFVGDKLHEDISGPKELGMRAVLTQQFRHEDPDGAAVQPDAVIATLSELLPYLDSSR